MIFPCRYCGDHGHRGDHCPGRLATPAAIISDIERLGDAIADMSAQDGAPRTIGRRVAGHVHEGVIHLAAALVSLREAREVDRG